MSNLPRVLDACCGGRMFWFDSRNPDALYVDKRAERRVLTDTTRAPGSRVLNVAPDLLADFTALPFPEASFWHVVFDPPHLTRAGRDSWMALKYGKLPADWREELRKGFAECFRVLKPNGTLVFKWNETHVPVSDVLKLASARPLYGNRCGRRERTHWIVFVKEVPDA